MASVRSRAPRSSFDSRQLSLNVQSVISDMARTADERLTQYPVITKVAKSLGLRPVYIPLVAAVLVSMLFGVLDNLITNVVGFFYPAWQSFKAVESPSPHDDRQWLTYWVVYAFFTFVEIFGDFLLFWVPCYYLFKVAFLLWLFLPQFKGASYIYSQAIRPFLLQHEDKIEETLSQIVGASTTSHSAVVGEPIIREANKNK